MKQSKELTKFYKAYYKWIKNGAKKNNKYNFQRKHGICSAITSYALYCSDSNCTLYSSKAGDMSREIKEQFSIANLHHLFPFGKDNYEDGYKTGSSYEDKNRVRWVKKHCKRNVKKKFKNK